jgi:5-methylcytosine-specific restriction protein B
MLNAERLSEILTQYKQDFVTKQWEDERYKWEAVKHFQDNWDVNASDFPGMLSRALGKTYNLLASAMNFPGKMIVGFAENEPESVRGMFINLFDEAIDLAERISVFKAASAELLVAHGAGNHYQTENSITTYLWLRYPDKYYIYKFGQVKQVALELETGLVIKQGAYADNLRNHYDLYNELCAELSKDQELVGLLRSQLDDDCYPDTELRTLTIDVGFYISRQVARGAEDAQVAQDDGRDAWFPAADEYHPGLSADDWEKLLHDPAIFTPSSLEIVKRFKNIGGQASCVQLAETFGKSAAFYNGVSSSLAKRVREATDCELMPRNSADSRWWPVLYTGRNATAQERGSYIWRLRDELSEALDRVNLDHVELHAQESEVPVLESLAEEEELPALEDPVEPYTGQNFLSEVYMTEERYGQLVGLLRNKKNIILQGAPGVGKTFAAKRLAWSMMGEKDHERVEFVQFHQNYSYEDFMLGYKPAGEGFELKHGIFFTFCQRAAAQPDQEFFFIIDEINRGNMSKVFGELLMLIERDYRGTSATLAYNGQPFSVPANLHIIGMMNTADRSLAMIDYALRRRFSFLEIEPGFETQGFTKYREKFAHDTFNELIGRIKDLNVEIAQDRSLGKGFCIGHSYVCGQDEITEDWIRSVIEYDIVPMLEEYWFDDPTKLQRWVNNLRAVLQR